MAATMEAAEVSMVGVVAVAVEVRVAALDERVGSTELEMEEATAAAMKVAAAQSESQT